MGFERMPQTLRCAVWRNRNFGQPHSSPWLPVLAMTMEPAAFQLTLKPKYKTFRERMTQLRPSKFTLGLFIGMLAVQFIILRIDRYWMEGKPIILLAAFVIVPAMIFIQNWKRNRLCLNEIRLLYTVYQTELGPVYDNSLDLDVWKYNRPYQVYHIALAHLDVEYTEDFAFGKGRLWVNNYEASSGYSHHKLVFLEKEKIKFVQWDSSNWDLKVVYKTLKRLQYNPAYKPTDVNVNLK